MGLLEFATHGWERYAMTAAGLVEMSTGISPNILVIAAYKTQEK